MCIRLGPFRARSVVVVEAAAATAAAGGGSLAVNNR
jgi:hypothetical protein